MKNFFLSGMRGASDVAGSSLAEQISFIDQGGSASSDDLTSLSVNSSNRSNAIGDYAAVPSNAASELSAGSAFAFAHTDAVVSDGVVAPGTDAANQSIDVKGTNFDDMLLGADIPGVRSFMAGLAGDNTLRGRSGFGVADYIDTPLLAAPIYTVSPLMGADLIIVVFAIIVIGGMGSILGSIITSLSLGLLEGLAKVVYPQGSNMVVFVIMIAVLLIKPAGLLGRER